ncbi:thiamine-phosphate kinase [Granulicoccus sp. GXG6511]|uniref:thiamine-phosphate kinase n=1 Tax=Granulicoccus sp. GXG6511 TaxID=3381351 RepID=UPI003D7C85A0
MTVPSPKESHSLGELGEFGLIASITADLDADERVPIGPGDDGAVVRIDGDLVVSTDTVVEGVHFRSDWSLPHEVGQRAIAAAVADLIAMGARPVAMVIAFSGPGELAASWAKQCTQGMKLEAAKSGIALVGGDVTSGPVVVLTVTVLGDLAGHPPILRSGARPGHVVALRGRIGWSAAGLRVLSRGFRSPRALVEAYKVPEVVYSAGGEARAAGATAMIDVSDGLLADLGHVAEASGVRINVRRDAFTLPEPLQAVSAAIGADPWTFILTGGEDHAFAATFTTVEAVPNGWLVIGEVAAGEPGVTVDGAAWDAAGGWDHFHRG